ncbi:MAG: carboxypeptidase-like regulatory domain-containing protein [Clostridiales bacterium]|nr:carboxypeptidase-like regulatory domain-containing protein [Clostridiales bacterium]
MNISTVFAGTTTWNFNDEAFDEYTTSGTTYTYSDILSFCHAGTSTFYESSTDKSNSYRAFKLNTNSNTVLTKKNFFQLSLNKGDVVSAKVFTSTDGTAVNLRLTSTTDATSTDSSLYQSISGSGSKYNSTVPTFTFNAVSSAGTYYLIATGSNSLLLGSITVTSADLTEVKSKITVTDESGDAIDNFTVTNNSTSTAVEADDDGYYTLYDGYSYTVSKTGYKSYTFEADAETTSYEVTLSASTAVPVTVKDAHTGAEITDYSIEGLTAEKEGYYSPESGETYTVSADGYESGTLTGDDSDSYTVELNPYYTVTLTTPEGGIVAILDKAASSRLSSNGVNYKATYGTTYTVAAHGYAPVSFTPTANGTFELEMTAETSKFTKSFEVEFDKSVASHENIADGIYALEAMTYSSVLKGVTNPILDDNDIPVAGAVMKFVAGASGSLSVDYQIATSGKTAYVVSVSSDGTVSTVQSVKATSDNQNGTFTFDVTAGYTYYVYASGSKLGFTSATFTANTYVYFGITAEQAESSASYTIYEDDTEIATGYTVYEGVDTDNDGESDGEVSSYTDLITADNESYSNCKYIIAYVLDPSLSDSTLSIVLTELESATVLTALNSETEETEGDSESSEETESNEADKTTGEEAANLLTTASETLVSGTETDTETSGEEVSEETSDDETVTDNTAEDDSSSEDNSSDDGSGDDGSGSDSSDGDSGSDSSDSGSSEE